jgi:type I restriction enzyme M protein
MVDRAERALSDEDIARIADTYHAWRGTHSAASKKLTYEDVPGFCKSVTVDAIKAVDYAVTPGRYVDTLNAAIDDEPIDQKIARLRAELIAALDKSRSLDEKVRQSIERVS